jgi:hypothetical protein
MTTLGQSCFCGGLSPSGLVGSSVSEENTPLTGIHPGCYFLRGQGITNAAPPTSDLFIMPKHIRAHNVLSALDLRLRSMNRCWQDSIGSSTVTNSVVVIESDSLSL